jgi:hypothetical protein
MAGRRAVSQDAVLADDPIAGNQRRGGPAGDRPGVAEELQGGQLGGDRQRPGGRCGACAAAAAPAPPDMASAASAPIATDVLNCMEKSSSECQRLLE